MSHVRHLFAVSLLAGMTATAFAEPEKPKPAPVSSVYELIGCIDDERLQKELKLSAEQVKKLLAERQRIWDAWYETPMQDWTKKRTTLHAGTAAVFKDCLDEAQFKRACELARQLIWGRAHYNGSGFASPSESTLDLTRIHPRFLAEHPDLAEALCLSDDQQKLLTTDSVLATKRVILLTTKQIDIGRDLLGTPPSARWEEKFDPRQFEVSRDWFHTVPPGLLRVALDGHVKAELKVTPTQTAELTKLHKDWSAIVSNPLRLSPAEALAETQKFRQASEKALATIVDAEQLRRLQQLAVRARHDPDFGATDGSLIPNLANDLKATWVQRGAFDRIRAKHAEAVERAVNPDKEYDEIHLAILAANRAREQEYEAVLTPEQKQTLKPLVGEPLASRRRGATPPTIEASNRRTREEAFGHQTNEMNWRS